VLTAVVISVAVGLTAYGEEVKPCTACHADIQSQFRKDVHAGEDIECTTCHGKSRKHSQSKDGEVKPDVNFGMSKGGGPSQFKDRIPPCCGQCHEDELADYAESRHAELIDQGDPNSAACTDCHGKHATRKATDSASPTNSAKVGALCAQCHGDRELMQDYPSRFDIQAHLAKEAKDWSLGQPIPNCGTCHRVHTELSEKQSRRRHRGRTARGKHRRRVAPRRSRGIVALDDKAPLPDEIARGEWRALDAADTKSWRRSGKWQVSGGEVCSMQTRSFLVWNHTPWKQYAFSVEAQKLGGRSGLLVAFEVDGHSPVWLVGGFGGRGSEVSGIRGTKTNFAPEVGKWVCIHVVVSENTIDGFIDGKRCWSAKRQGRHVGNFITRRPAGIGVGVWDSKAKFRRMRVLPLK